MTLKFTENLTELQLNWVIGYLTIWSMAWFTRANRQEQQRSIFHVFSQQIWFCSCRFSLKPIQCGWWFGTMEFYDFPFHIWDVILPIDELHHFSRWWNCTTNRQWIDKLTRVPRIFPHAQGFACCWRWLRHGVLWQWRGSRAQAERALDVEKWIPRVDTM